MTFKRIATGFTIAALMVSTAFAQGGNDPIPGIDIIIKRDPGSQPLQAGRYGEKEIGLTYNAGAEKLNARLQELVAQTVKLNSENLNSESDTDAKMKRLGKRSEVKDARDRYTKFEISETKVRMKGVMEASKDLSKQVADGDAGASSFTYAAADGKSKITVTISIRGDEDDARDVKQGRDNIQAVRDRAFSAQTPAPIQAGNMGASSSSATTPPSRNTNSNSPTSVFTSPLGNTPTSNSSSNGTNTGGSAPTSGGIQGDGEICDDGIDNNGDGYIDGDDVNCIGSIGATAVGNTTNSGQNSSVTPTTTTPGNGGMVEICNDLMDNDLDGNIDLADSDCAGSDQDLDGFISVNFGGDDCDDQDPTVNPSGIEIPNDGIDQNCDGNDFLSGGSSTSGGICVMDSDCAGSEACNVTTQQCAPIGSFEICVDGMDNDGNGQIDEGCTFQDQDQDGFISVDVGGTDCDDTDPLVHLGAPDAPNDGMDWNCDGND